MMGALGRFLLDVFGRPLLFIGWSLVVWGSLLWLTLGVKAVTEGTGAAAEAIRASAAIAWGQFNLGVMAGALLVWTALAVARLARASDRDR